MGRRGAKTLITLSRGAGEMISDPNGIGRGVAGARARSWFGGTSSKSVLRDGRGPRSEKGTPPPQTNDNRDQSFFVTGRSLSVSTRLPVSPLDRCQRATSTRLLRVREEVS